MFDFLQTLLAYKPPFVVGAELLFTLPATLGYVVLGLIVIGYISAAGFVLARLGIKPLWALVLLIPFAELISVIFFAHMPWPREALLPPSNKEQS